MAADVKAGPVISGRLDRRFDRRRNRTICRAGKVIADR
jgi:hypothetical protein